MNDEKKLAQQIVITCRKLLLYGLTYASLGNVSARLGDNYILITPSGVRFDALEPDKIVKVDLDGNVVSNGKPSVELSMHLEIYRNFEEARAVIHAHSIFSTILGSVKGDIIPMCEEAKLFGVEKIPVCKPAMHGTKELAKNVVDSLSKSRATIIPYHGVVVYGDDLDNALQVIEVVESSAKMNIIEALLTATMT